MALLWLCCAVSGAAALALEMLWMRSAGLVIGQTAATAATVLAWYFAGLGFGALAGRDVGRRPIRSYALFEVGAGVGILWSLAVFRAAAGATMQRWLDGTQPIGGIAIVLVATLPATVCLGASFPALGRALERGQRAGPRAALLYALNTLGGTVGVAAAGFGMPAWIGVTASYAVVAAQSASPPARWRWSSIGARTDRASAPAQLPSRGTRRRRWLRLRLVAAGAGALALGLEVLWTRLFAQVLHNSVYSFAAIVLVCVLALAAGAALAALGLRRGASVGMASGAHRCGVGDDRGPVAVRRADRPARVHRDAQRAGQYLLHHRAGRGHRGPAALCSGVVLPVLWAAWGRTQRAWRGHWASSRPPRWVASPARWSWLSPSSRISACARALLAVAITYVVLADVVGARAQGWRPLAYAALVLAAVADPLRAPLVNLRDGETLRAVAEGASGVVSVVETPDDLQLRLDNFYILGGRAAALNERRLGLVPLLLHPAPRRACSSAWPPASAPVRTGHGSRRDHGGGGGPRGGRGGARTLRRMERRPTRGAATCA
jgi:spermidine synthase